MEADFNCTEESLTDVGLTYWSDADSAHRTLARGASGPAPHTFQIPAPGRDVVLYYFFAATWSGPSGPNVQMTPSLGSEAPSVYFVSHNHLGDMDLHGDLLDVFDLVRLLRHEAWGEALPWADRLNAAGVAGARQAAAVLLRPVLNAEADAAVSSVTSDETHTRMTFADGSAIVVPRTWHDRITELTVSEGMASTLMTSRAPFRALDSVPSRLMGLDRCLQSIEVVINQVFYRREPQMMRRYLALAYDNIRLDPPGFLLASAYRGVRVFIIEGASDRVTAQQFTSSGRIYAVGTAVSMVLFIVCATGVVVGWRQGENIGLPLLLIVSVPATLAPVLINMRYTVTIQPLMFVFIATAITWWTRSPAASADPPVSRSSAG